jgi:hypothetical protein
VKAYFGIALTGLGVPLWVVVIYVILGADPSDLLGFAAIPFAVLWGSWGLALALGDYADRMVVPRVSRSLMWARVASVLFLVGPAAAACLLILHLLGALP